jgi:stress response protein SCP2
MCIWSILAGILICTVLFTIIFMVKKPAPDGKIVVTQGSSGKKVFSLELDKTPEEIETMNVISFKVVTYDDLVN